MFNVDGITEILLSQLEAMERGGSLNESSSASLH